VCVRVLTSEQNDFSLRHVAWCGYIKFVGQGHRRKNVAKVIGATSIEGFSSLTCYYICCK